MKKNVKNLLYSFFGIFIGSAIVCTILFLTKDKNYIRFWSYAGYLYYPVFYFVSFCPPFLTYLLLNKMFKFDIGLSNWDFFIISLAFPLLDELAKKLFPDFRTIAILFVILLFWFLVGAQLIFKQIIRKLKNFAG